MPQKTAHSIISQHVTSIARRGKKHQFAFQFVDNDNKRVRPAEHSRALLSAAALTWSTVQQVEGRKPRSMCGAARWHLQQVRLGVALHCIQALYTAVPQQQCLKAAGPCRDWGALFRQLPAGAMVGKAHCTAVESSIARCSLTQCCVSHLQEQPAPTVDRKASSQSQASAAAGVRLPAGNTASGGQREAVTLRTPPETCCAAQRNTNATTFEASIAHVHSTGGLGLGNMPSFSAHECAAAGHSSEALWMVHQSDPTVLLQAGLKRARHEPLPATAKTVASAISPSQASQVVMQLEGYCPERFPPDVQQQVCRQQQRWKSQLISVRLREFHHAIWSVMSPQLCLPARQAEGLAPAQSPSAVAPGVCLDRCSGSAGHLSRKAWTAWLA